MQPTAYPFDHKNLEQYWHTFVTSGQVHAIEGFRPDPAVIQSWVRSRPRLDPMAKPQLTRAGESTLASIRKTHADLLMVAIPYLEDIHQFIEGSDCAILVADGAACILTVGGDPSTTARIDELGLGVGTYWAEG